MKILLIDDDPTSNSLNEILLEYFDKNIKVVSFHSAMHAVNHVKKHHKTRFDLTFIDLEMADLEGWQTVEALQNHKCCCPNIIILTAYLTQTEIATAKTYPAVIATLKKPLSIAKIEELVNLVSNRVA